jgi:dGTPase
MTLSCNNFAANEKYANRYNPEDEHPYRGRFSRDRDRILYSKEFRRLSGKTQVFVTGFDDHVRTRLTHTLEVAQISKTIAGSLQLNETLTEAIAFAHDLGHTPFGHIGERTLNHFMNGCDVFKDFNSSVEDEKKGFKHNWQGLKVVSTLEKLKPTYDGLNLTDYTMWGILNHSRVEWGECPNYDPTATEKPCKLRHRNEPCKNAGSCKLDYYRYLADTYLTKNSWTVEGLLVKWADEIAQRHHDLEDGLEARIIDKNEFLQNFEQYFRDYLTKDEKRTIEKLERQSDRKYSTPSIGRLIINFYVTNIRKHVIEGIEEIETKYEVASKQDFDKKKREIVFEDISSAISFEPEFVERDKAFQKEYLGNRILNSYLAQSMDGKANYIIRQLIKAYLTNPQQLPDPTICTLYGNYKNLRDVNVGKLRLMLNKDHIRYDPLYSEVLLRTICDYIAGMTDQWALQQYDLLYHTRIIGK